MNTSSAWALASLCAPVSFVSGVCTGGKLLVDIGMSGDGKQYHRLTAKIDTGANITAMRMDVLDKVKCPWIARHNISTASGYVEADSFEAFVGLFTGGRISQKRPITIIALPFHAADYHILLGMDVLAHCCFVCRGGSFFLGFDGADKTTLKAAAAFVGE